MLRPTEKWAISSWSVSLLFSLSRKYTDINTVKTAYFAYIESRLTYGVLAWGCASKESIEKVFKKQKKN